MNKPKTAMVTEQTVDTLRVYVPTSRRRVADGSIALAKAQLLAGGWTCRYVEGGWIDPFGNTISEPVDEYELPVSLDKAQAVRQYLIALSEELLAAGEQAVLVVVIHSYGPTITYTLS